MDLQYLPSDKQREPDADIRKMLIEAIMLVSRRHTSCLLLTVGLHLDTKDSLYLYS